MVKRIPRIHALMKRRATIDRERSVRGHVFAVARVRVVKGPATRRANGDEVRATRTLAALQPRYRPPEVFGVGTARVADKCLIEPETLLCIIILFI